MNVGKWLIVTERMQFWLWIGWIVREVQKIARFFFLTFSNQFQTRKNGFHRRTRKRIQIQTFQKKLRQLSRRDQFHPRNNPQSQLSLSIHRICFTERNLSSRYFPQDQAEPKNRRFLFINPE
ncbi:hypothetical protein BLNAU_10188 [Blattamonas nauphoetae]|uniref:Uncharacterized protein n=1 Tax=Blattamonas nauphoetae TaxID=2049346 RepID=A0ABQ9XTQ1_9EUKA|nr:hypothetical protein BLNAU_10188 [Blattamonas nauphoetae]